MKQKTGLRNVDYFTAVNVSLFLAMCYVAYYERFLHYRGRANLQEFFLYATVIILAILGARRLLDRFTFSTRLLILVQVGICVHFVGGLVIVEGMRVYDFIFFGVRYDKYVHLYNAGVAAGVLAALPWWRAELGRPLRDLLLLVTVLGLGTMIEIVEYLVTLTVQHHGVGNYDNNMCDLIANVLGCLGYLILSRMAGWIRERGAVRQQNRLNGPGIAPEV